jgi:hydrogenase nickel incorporation protein HypA/HybF
MQQATGETAMHELSIALTILDLVEEEGRNRGGRIAVIHIKLGPLCGVVKEALASAFELAREGTALSQAELVIEEVPLVLHCSVCAADQTPASPYELSCPVCGALTNEIVSGRELEVHALEIES